MSPVLQFPHQAAPSDDAARRQALDTRISCIVEAPAGSGKTGLLMQRYLKLLADESVTQPEEVLAITFTNKATAELRERIVRQLELANQPAPEDLKPFDLETRTLAAAVLARSAELQWHILHRPQQLNIRTIDSVCAEIANALPLLSGSGGTRRPTTSPMPLYRQAAQKTLMQLGGPDADLNAALRTVLLHRDASLADVETLLADMLGQREQWGEAVPLTPTGLDNQHLDTEVRLKLERTLEFIVCSALTRAANAMPPGLLAELTTLAAGFSEHPPYKADTSPLAICSGRHAPPEAVAEHLDHWLAIIHLLLKKDGDWRKRCSRADLSFEIPKPDQASLEQRLTEIQSDELLDALCAVRNLPPARYPDDQWAVTRSLFHVLRRALAELKILFAERGECDFTEISIAAREALASLDSDDDTTLDLALTPGGRLRHLLVDEMQDTSAAQYELIHLLTRSWDGASQTLFLVGDPKQSIYLFRQARVERFLRTMRDARLGDIPLIPLRLTTNFRSQAALVQDFNHTFKQLFPSLEEVTQTHNTAEVPFVAATPNRASTDTADIAWHTFLTDPATKSVILSGVTCNASREIEVPAMLSTPSSTPAPFNRETTSSAQTARDIRGIIQHWQNEPLPEGRTKPWQIAILARNRSHLDPIVAELKKDYGNGPIPYRAVDIDPLADRSEVLDALALTRAILHPADRAAWLAVLHAPWCGLSLADLLTLTGSDSAHATIATLIEQNFDSLSSEGQQLLHRAWPILEASINTLGTSTVATHVERTWLSLGGDATLTAAQRSNISRYFDTLRELQSESSHLDLTQLTDRLKTLYAEPATGNIQVELLTIHKAKGLEWDVVLVPSLERKSGSNGDDLLNWLEIDNAPADASPVILAPISRKGSDADKLNKWLSAAREARENAERKRLFYVLCTRAAEELHLFAACKRKSDDTLATPTHGSLLKAVWPAAAPAFDNLTASTDLNADLQNSLLDEEEDDDEQPFALAASAEAAPKPFPPPMLHRLPLDFKPLARFTAAEATRLPYTPASALPQSPIFTRPEGSFAARAFGNVVHRFLQLLSTRLNTTTPDQLLIELPAWQPRLLASLRSEGLSPALAQREASRALSALERALADELGRWILSPQPSASTERALTFANVTFRADRTFLAAANPQATGDSHIWIVDFKTTELHARDLNLFEQEERSRYSPQLNSYAEAFRSLTDNAQPIMLALYYPLIPHLIYWPAAYDSP